MSTRVGAKTKGWIKNNVTGETKSFMFNPTELEYSRSITYSDITSPGMCYPGTQFVKGESRSFSVELFIYDRPFTKKVNEFMIFVGALLTSERNLKSNPKRPPDFTFCLGYFVRRCVLEDLKILIEQFDEDGNPIQARFTLQIRQVSP